MREIGTEIAGMTVAQSLRRKSAMTPTTRAIVRSNVKRTSARLAAMVWVRSETISTSMPGGSEARSCGRAFLIAATADMTLAPGSRKTDSTTAGLPLSQPPSVVSTGAFIARPMSRMRIGRPAAIGDDRVVKALSRRQLVIRLERGCLLTAVEQARRLNDGQARKRSAHRFEIKIHRGELGRVELDSDRGTLVRRRPLRGRRPGLARASAPGSSRRSR